MNKQEKFLFKCPHCGGDILHTADRSIVWYKINHIGTIYDVPVAGGHEHLDYQQENSLGYRCGECGYPDYENPDSFAWKSIQDAIDVGAVIPDPMNGKRQVNCLVCFTGGHSLTVAVIVNQDERLSNDHKAEIIERLVPEGFSPYAIVLCEEELKQPWGCEPGTGTIETKFVFDLSDYHSRED